MAGGMKACVGDTRSGHPRVSPSCGRSGGRSACRGHGSSPTPADRSCAHLCCLLAALAGPVRGLSLLVELVGDQVAAAGALGAARGGWMEVSRPAQPNGSRAWPPVTTVASVCHASFRTATCVLGGGCSHPCLRGPDCQRGLRKTLSGACHTGKVKRTGERLRALLQASGGPTGELRTL